MTDPREIAARGRSYVRYTFGTDGDMKAEAIDDETAPPEFVVDETAALDVERVRTWAAIEAIDNPLASAAFNRCADEIERLRGEYDDLRMRYDTLAGDWWES